MSSIGKIQAALAAATNEFTVAAANINFDFTLIKCEPPQEFHPLGSALTQRRKEDAEYGSTHITARRLGALFEGLLPSTPTLLRAYGTRVSEIAQTSSQTVSPEPDNSMFAAHAGIDGTSIWAAATSSPTALHVQLLACMLARQWPASEATSIWEELVEERRKELGDAFNQNHAIPYASLTAATQSQISRTSLAQWDASARSWLRTADRIKFKHQNQLMLLIANVSVPVSDDMKVYQSVIPAWKSALESTEKLMSGMPQATNYGPCLLAISSWHLYPDIIFTGQITVSHKFEDPLVRPGGTLTLGLARPGGEMLRGVFWSLSLAHLNFYGRRPVQKEAVLNLHAQKLSFQQFTVSVFGAFLAYWGAFGSDGEAPARFFIKLRDAIHALAKDEKNPWHTLRTSCIEVASDGAHPINVLARASDTFLEAQEFEDDLDLKLIALGGKKADKFLPQASAGNFMGLGNPRILLSLLKGPDERISLLRRILSDSDLTIQKQESCLIRFFVNSPRRSHKEGESRPLPGIASAHPQPVPSVLPGADFADCRHVRYISTRTHRRWAEKHPREVIYNMPDHVVSQMASMHGEFELPHALKRQLDYDSSRMGQTYSCIFGDPGSAAIYSPTDLPGVRPRKIRPTTFHDLIWCLEHELFDMEAMLKFFDLSVVPPGHLGTKAEGMTLKSMRTAQRIYQSLPTATVSTRAFNTPLYSPRWASQIQTDAKVDDSLESSRWKDHQKPDAHISQDVAFSCVAWLEAGVDLNPPDLARVFALAYEDSIYVSMNLTCDPWESPSSHELKRIAGNVGKPGLTLLVPPDDPVVPAIEESEWRVLGTSEFDGLAEDRFSQTSMHLSFTKYYFPLVQAGEGQGQDKQVHYLESVVSIHHAGRWIGDVDVQKCLASNFLTPGLQYPCRNKHIDSKARSMRSIESWEDVIDPPPGDAVVRAHGNWVARLATTAVLIHVQEAREGGASRGVFVLSNDTCWKCIAQSGIFTSMGFRKHSISYTPGIFNIMVF